MGITINSFPMDRLNTSLATLDTVIQKEKEMASTLKELRKKKKLLMKEIEIEMQNKTRDSVTTPNGIPLQLTSRLEFCK